MRAVLSLCAAVAVAAGLAAATGGADPFARVLLSAGLPGLAAHVADSPGLRAVALDRAGDHSAAAEAFAEAGDSYNQGVSAARAGDYATALAAWDAVLLHNPEDAQARANYDLVAGLFAGTRFDPVAIPTEDREGPTAAAEVGLGNARAGGTGDEANSRQSGFIMPELLSSGIRRVSQQFDAQHVAADDQWLTTLADAPGQYLSARLSAEQKAREEQGTALPVPEDPE